MSESIGREYHLVLTDDEYRVLQSILYWGIEEHKYTDGTNEVVTNIRRQLYNWNSHLNGVKP